MCFGFWGSPSSTLTWNFLGLQVDGFWLHGRVAAAGVHWCSCRSSLAVSLSVVYGSIPLIEKKTVHQNWIIWPLVQGSLRFPHCLGQNNLTSGAPKTR